MKRFFLIWLCAVSVLAICAETPSCPLPNYRLVWHDEFDGDSLSSDWQHVVWPKGRVNKELQEYVRITTPGGQKVTRVEDGVLYLTAFREKGKIYSGRVNAMPQTGWKYGYFEARIRLPKGRGTWPAFWLLPAVEKRRWPHDGEIDIMEEVGFHPNYVSSSLHAEGHVHTNHTQVTHEMLQEGAEDEFHVYSMLWTEDRIITYVDGVEQLNYVNPGTGKVDWPYDTPYFIILNLAWGGTWGGEKGVDNHALPTTMAIDYVRVWQAE